jgi:hypothetical protein
MFTVLIPLSCKANDILPVAWIFETIPEKKLKSPYYGKSTHPIQRFLTSNTQWFEMADIELVHRENERADQDIQARRFQTQPVIVQNVANHSYEIMHLTREHKTRRFIGVAAAIVGIIAPICDLIAKCDKKDDAACMKGSALNWGLILTSAGMMYMALYDAVRVKAGDTTIPQEV